MRKSLPSNENGWRIQAEKEASVTRWQAAGELAAAEKYAEALRIRAESKGVAAEKLAGRRVFELKCKRIEMLASSAAASDLVVAGNHGDNLLAQITAAARSTKLLGLSGLPSAPRVAPKTQAAT